MMLLLGSARFAPYCFLRRAVAAGSTGVRSARAFLQTSVDGSCDSFSPSARPRGRSTHCRVVTMVVIAGRETAKRPGPWRRTIPKARSTQPQTARRQGARERLHLSRFVRKLLTEEKGRKRALTKRQAVGTNVMWVADRQTHSVRV
eukprot:6180717-Pleurochrysis_carterae.AAC.3